MNQKYSRPKVSGHPYPYYISAADADTFAQMIQQKTDKCGNAPAFSFRKNKEDVSKSFQEFEQDVIHAASFMLEKGWKQKHVGLCFGNSYEWIVLFMALTISGNIAVAFNPDLPEAELLDLAKTADCRLFFASKAVAKKLSGLDENAITLLDPEAFIKEANAEPATVKRISELDLNQPDRLAALYFTSGTTGKSKAVMLSEKNITSDINGTVKLFEPSGKTLAILPFYHSFGFITGILKAYHYGVETFINQSLRRMMSDFERIKPVEVFMVPLIVETVHKRIWKQIEKSGQSKKVRRAMQLSNLLLKMGIDVRKRFFSEITDALGGRLEYVICGGAVLDQKYIDDFKAWGIQILAGYGITECSPVASVNRNHYQKANSCGQLVKGLQVKISDDGEVLMKGDMVFSGYYNDPKSTEEAFEDGWFHTGDLGYLDDEQFLFLSGRSKNLIILSNGENISPEQIEMELLKFDQIEEVVVYEEDGKIAAEIYPSPDTPADESEFKELIASYNQNRPIDHQISRIHLRDHEFEKNASKKIIRKWH